MERFSGFNDPLTGRNPFVERGVDYVGLSAVQRALYGGIQTYLIPLIGLARIPLVLAFSLLWVPFQLLPRVLGRHVDALFARLLLFCMGTYRICCFTSTKGNPRYASFKTPPRFHVASQLTNPLDVLAYTVVFRPGFIHIPYEDRLRKPFLAFFRAVFYQNYCPPRALKDSAHALFVSTRYPCICFPEGGPTNGTVLMVPTVTLQVPGTVVCAAVKYGPILSIPTVARPYPTVSSFIHDVGVPLRAIDVQTVTQNGVESVMQGIGIAAGVPSGSLDAKARIEFLKRYMRKRDKDE
ncbi:hypothetical protein GMRT_10840 [Giardia muris]|uniref:Acyltransferase n=1 Tax=Giardia muris TaxID=5742 RepID=A0A4Z1T3A3_GIAMU|nr:hypothetical protein GMRT_10840 [Giardia muris]|eukprot:TNJ27537.1 hypothetical protein GMRT_10840 [Giardia muris]